MRRSLLVLSSVLLAVPPVVMAQSPSARDAFWSASDLVSVAPNPGAKKTAHAAAQHKVSVVKTSGTAHIAPQLVAQNGYGEQPHLVRTSLSTQQIGLRYSLLLRDPDGTYHEASPDAVFHNGDHLRISMMSNEPGYLYVITRGSSGNWSPIFPDPHAAADSNHIAAGKVYQIPDDDHAFEFDKRAGTEKLFVVLSRERIADLDGAMDRLKSPAPAAAPVTAPQGQGQVLEADNHIPDELVQKLASRGLTLVTEEKVDHKASNSDNGEKAVYVVAKQTSGGSNEVVAKISLIHE